MVTLTLVSLFGLWAATPQSISMPAGRFVHYFHSLEKTDRSVGFWERVVFSLLLASAPETDPARDCSATS